VPARRPFGCLTGLLTGLVLALLIVGVVVGAADAVFAPWAFYLGGRFHPWPGWQGIGTVHTDAGDYGLYLSMMPQPSGPGSRSNLPYLRGTAEVCTPRGERFRMRLSASLHEHPGTDTNGMAIDVTMYTRRWNYSWTNEARPRLELRGRWQNPDLVMDDRGTLSRAFLPDGTAYLGPTRNQPRVGKPLTIVVHELPWTTWFPDCATSLTTDHH
jgi:hypothetical protein